MDNETGQRLKNNWVKEPPEHWAPLTFGELNVGEKFISMPSPGDNSGHGGFRGTSRVFTKIVNHVDTTNGGIELPYAEESPHGRSVDSRGQTVDQPLKMPVIRIE